jgi:magnesium transporter
MFKTRHSIPGTPPGSLIPSDHTTTGGPTVLKVVEYHEGDLVEHTVRSVAELPACNVPGRMHWIEMNGTGNPEMLRALGEKYGLHQLALEDVLHTGQRPKVELYDHHLFIVAQMLYRDEEQRMCGEQVSMFLGKNLLITVQEDADADVFEPVRTRLRGGRGQIRKLGPDYLAYALLDSIIDHCFPILEALGDALEEMEDEVVDQPSAKCVATLHAYRRTLMQMRRLVWPERDVVNYLMHDDSGFVSKQTKVYLRDCYDHTVQIMDLIESYRDVTGGMMELYLSAVSQRTNEIMRVLTVMSSIFIPLTFIAGVYGMNFDTDNGANPWNMPELHWRYGYIFCLVLMAAVAFGMLWYFKRKRWF